MSMDYCAQSPGKNPFIRPRGDSRPIHKLPFELLSLIFEFGAARNDLLFAAGMRTASNYHRLEAASGEERETMSFTRSPFQVTVSYVCRCWRDVATSTASLWTDIRLSTVFARPPYKIISLYLERSKSLPLDITVQDRSDDSSYTAGFDAKFLYSLLISHVHRWRSIHLSCAQSQHMSAFLAIVSDPSIASASQLESLLLHHHFQDVDEFLGDPVLLDFQTIFNGSAPRLKHLILDVIHVEWSQKLISAASNLTCLELINHIQPVRPSWTEFATILRGAPQLQKLALCLSRPAELPEDWVLVPTGTSASVNLNAPIPLPQLTELVLGAQPEDVAIALLRKLCMPAIETLILDFKDGDYSNFVEELTRPATSANPSSTQAEEPASSLLTQLKQLAILNLPCANKEVTIRMFLHLENLKTLRLSLKGDSNSNSDPPGTSLLLQLLRPFTLLDSGVVAYTIPRLERLLVSPTKSNLLLLADVVQQRQDAGVPLKSLCLSLRESISIQEITWFRERLELCWLIDEVHGACSDRAFEGYWL